MVRIKNHQDRVALISRLEKQYSKKLTKLNWHNTPFHKTWPTLHGMKIRENQYLDYEATT